MNNDLGKNKRGFVMKIVLIVIALFALSYYFNWTPKDLLQYEWVQKTVAYIKQAGTIVWQFILSILNK